MGNDKVNEKYSNYNKREELSLIRQIPNKNSGAQTVMIAITKLWPKNLS